MTTRFHRFSSLTGSLLDDLNPDVVAAVGALLDAEEESTSTLGTVAAPVTAIDPAILGAGNVVNGPWGNIYIVPGSGEEVTQNQEFTLGTASRPWGAIYAELGVIETSDARSKSFVTDSTLGRDFILGLKPVSYTLKKYPSSTASFGFLGQDVEKALKGMPFAGLVKEDGNYALRYTHFIAPLVKCVQQQQAQIDRMAEDLMMLKMEIERLKSQG